jgi:hypothetical protein
VPDACRATLALLEGDALPPVQNIAIYLNDLEESLVIVSGGKKRKISTSTTATCGFNRSMQHLFSKHKEGDVDNEAKTEELLLRCTEGVDLGSLAETL